MLKHFLIFALLIPAGAQAQQWKLIAPMNHARSGCITVALDDGRLLAASGVNGAFDEQTSEVYDTAKKSWSLTRDLNSKRDHIGNSYTKISGGRIFVAGGYIKETGTTLSSTEIFDPVTNLWSYSTPLNETSEGGGITTLVDGRVLYAGGAVGGTTTYQSACEIFDPKTDSMKYTGSISAAQFANMVFPLANGHAILISGHYNGADGTWLDETEDYDPNSGSWMVTTHSQVPHDVSVLLPDGRIISSGGSIGPPSGALIGATATSVVEIYDPAKKAWQFIGNLEIPKYSVGLIDIGNDSVLVAGGLDPVTGKAIAGCEIINVRTGLVSPAPTMNVSRSGFRLISQVITEGNSEIVHIYAIGGKGGHEANIDGNDTSLSSCEMIEFHHSTSSNSIHLPQLGAIPEFTAHYDRASDQIILDGSWTDINIYNLMGEKIENEIPAAERIPGEKFASGLYIIQASDGKRVYSVEIIIFK